jgi:hypothetical protein
MTKTFCDVCDRPASHQRIQTSFRIRHEKDVLEDLAAFIEIKWTRAPIPDLCDSCFAKALREAANKLDPPSGDPMPCPENIPTVTARWTSSPPAGVEPCQKPEHFPDEASKEWFEGKS